MSTIRQKLKHIRIVKHSRCLVPALQKCPMKFATVVKVFKQAPKKPNSANRSVAKVKIKSSGRHVNCYLYGETHNLSKHSNVMIRGGRCQDLIGVRYKAIRGLENFEALDKRVTRKSKYGVKTKNK